MLRLLRASPEARTIQPLLVDDMTVEVKIHPRARRLTLRYDAKKQRFVLSVPKRASKKSMHAFVTANTAWMRTQIVVAPEPIVLRPGEFLALQGKDRLIVHKDGAGVHVELTDDTITVTCREARFARALQRYLQQRAYDVIAPLCYDKAALIERPIQSIQLRDTTTRWGSCTHDGKLSFCWRLIMAPQEVIDYVVGHEVAHLKVFDHSPRFWATCRALTPHTTFGKHWLQQQGDALHRINIIARDNRTA